MLFHRRLDSKYASELQRSMGMMKLRPGKKNLELRAKNCFYMYKTNLDLVFTVTTKLLFEIET